VGEALQSLPQISISDTIGNGNNPAIRMRGYGSSNVLVLIDGAPLNTATTQLPALNTIPLSTVSRIEIMEGSGGVLYGAGAVGGVINIVTTVSDESSLSLSAGSHGYGQVVAETAIPFATGVATVLVATTTSDGYRDNTDFDDNKFAIGLQSDTGGYQHRVDVQVTRAEQQYLSGSTADMLAANPRGGLTADTNDNETYRIQYRGTQLDQGNPLSVAAKWLKSSQQGTVSGTTQFNQTTESISVSPQLLIESYDMLVGLDAQATDFEFNSPTATYATRVQRSDQHQVSVFARRGVNVSENSHLALGARVTAVADDISKVDEAGGALTASTLRDKQTLTAWEAAIRHSLTENTQLTARVDTHYRIPTLDEQAGYSPFPSSLLKAQTGRSTELGLSTTLGRANLSANIYQTDLRNEIAFQSPANFSRYGNFNIDQTRRAGASATLRMPVSASAEVSANIARVDATITGGDHSGKKVPL
ncbi:MAG: TonB-dependent receptor, partial [Litorivicinus sp.]